MSILDGLAEEAFADFAEDFEDGVLTVPGGRTSDGQGGWISTEPIDHDCKALVMEYSDYRRLVLGIPATDRMVVVLGASLPSGVVPAKGQKITAPDPAKGLALTTFEVVSVTGDPAAAAYELQAH